MSENRELPLWQSIKQVRAFAIDEIVENVDGSYNLINNHLGICITVDAQYMYKHVPKIGGFYVQYADGYQSWSPASAFIGGYVPKGDMSLHQP